MAKAFKNAYQFKIELKNIKPKIWRTLQVPENYSFWDLHVAIQDVMGWHDCHLHEFEIIDLDIGEEVRIGIPDEEFDNADTLPGWKLRMADYFSLGNQTANYTYDFGDNWEHNIKLEKILPRGNNLSYPKCLDGKRACPPEDCGGCLGYEDILKIIQNPSDKEYKETLEWLGGNYDPEYFNPVAVHFDNPATRLKRFLNQ